MILLISPVFIASTCEKEEVFCTEELRAGLTVSLSLENSSHTSLEGITVTATDGDFTEALMTVEVTDFNFHGVFERAGSYVVTASKEGYQTFTSNAMTVAEDECHVITKNIDILLKSN